MAVGAGRQQLGGGPVAALAGREPLVELDGAHLLEEVDDGVAVGAEGQPGARRRAARRLGPMPSPRSRSVVGQKQAEVPLRPSRATSPSVRWVACTAVVRGPSSAGVGEQLRRGARRTPRGRRRSRRPARTGARAAGDRRRPSATVRELVARARRAPSAPRRRRRRRPGRRGRRWSPSAASSRPGSPRRRRRRRRSGTCAPSTGCAEAAAEVAGVEQGDPDPGLAAPPRPARDPWRWGRRTACRRAGGAGSGTRPTVVIPAAAISRYVARASAK